MAQRTETFVFGPLTFEVTVLKRYKDRIQYGIRVFMGDEPPFMVQAPFDIGFGPRFVARKVLRDLKKVVDQPDQPLLPSMWSWAAERPDSILEAARSENIT